MFSLPNHASDLFIHVFCWYKNLLFGSILKDTLMCLLRDTFYYKFVPYGNQSYLLYEILVSIRYTFVLKGLSKQISITFKILYLRPPSFLTLEYNKT